MRYIDVFNVFDNTILKKANIEVIKLKHGYMIFYWDNIEKAYYQLNTLIQTPEKLYEILSEEIKNNAFVE